MRTNRGAASLEPGPLVRCLESLKLRHVKGWVSAFHVVLQHDMQCYTSSPTATCIASKPLAAVAVLRALPTPQPLQAFKPWSFAQWVAMPLAIPCFAHNLCYSYCNLSHSYTFLILLGISAML